MVARLLAVMHEEIRADLERRMLARILYGVGVSVSPYAEDELPELGSIYRDGGPGRWTA